MSNIYMFFCYAKIFVPQVAMMDILWEVCC